jgi:hypothetical protein
MKSRFKALLMIVLPIFQIMLLSGCQTRFDESADFNHRSDLQPGGPAILATGSREEIRQGAISDARADIAAARPRIAITGGIAAWPVGVPAKYLDIVQRYPTVPLPCGCTSSWLKEAGIYAEAYNREILPYLLDDYKLHHKIKNS